MSQPDRSRAAVEGDKKKCKSCHAWKDKNQDFNHWEGKCKMCRNAQRRGITIEEEMARLSLKNGVRDEERKELEQARRRIPELQQQVAGYAKDLDQAQQEMARYAKDLDQAQQEVAGLKAGNQGLQLLTVERGDRNSRLEKELAGVQEQLKVMILKQEVLRVVEIPKPTTHEDPEPVLSRATKTPRQKRTKTTKAPALPTPTYSPVKRIQTPAVLDPPKTWRESWIGFVPDSPRETPMVAEKPKTWRQSLGIHFIPDSPK